MRRSMKRTVILLAAVGVTLAATLSCQKCDDKAPPVFRTEEQKGQPANNLELRGDGNTLINAIEIERGEIAEFKVANGAAYVLIPDAHLMIVDGNTEVPAVEGILAFVVGEGGVTVKVPADYPESKHPVVIHYSVLCFDKTGDVYYAEDESPPRMVIPPI